ncbi:hypothetical protein DFH06DRAFT_1272396 [Mycena polygramma]|nr:hypothetical protein DFH06DRAFT_1272396 [Mycena polygramma]
MPKATQEPKKLKKTKGPPGYNVRFAEVSENSAAQGRKVSSERENTTVAPRSLASDVPLNELWLTKEQKDAIITLNASKETVDLLYYSQFDAAACMASHGLDLDSREDIGNRWSVRWSTSSKKEAGRIRRVLLQCDCGYDHRQAGTTKRRTAVDFTGCLAYTEITFVLETQKILRIRGYLEHNEDCKKALMTRIPPLPLHPAVFRSALTQLANGVSLTDIQQRNQDWVKAGGEGLIPAHGRDWKHRWLLQRHDTRRMHGVKVSEQPHINLHEWLDPNSRQYNPTLAAAEDRLEMKEAAWKYGYRSQIVVDGTFGVCDLMGIDENKRGNQQSSAGYDTNILAKLLDLWRKSLEIFKGGKAFYVLERAALLRVFPDIVLLICKFHLRQSWRNHRNKLVKGKSAESLEQNIIEDERRVLTGWLESSHGVPAERGLLHLEYLSSYWLSFDLWASWSDFGRYAAAGILGCEFEGSFNGLLKRKYLRRWQRGGRRLRLDVLLQIIVVQAAEQDRISEWILALPGGQRLLERRKSGRSPADSVADPIAYFVPDLLHNHQISTPTLAAGTFSFTCYSSPVAYAIEIGTNGTASCTGPDFQKNGAGLLRIAELRQRFPDIPPIYLPTSEQEARVLRARFAVHSAHVGLAAVSSVTLPTVVAAQKINELLAPEGIGYEGEGGSDDEREDDDSLSDSDDDNESVATDASFNADELNVDNFILRTSNSGKAVDNQAIARVAFELARHAPKMQELANCLRGVEVHSEEQRSQLASYRLPLQTLLNQLDRLSISTSEPVTLPSIPPHTPPRPQRAELSANPLVFSSALPLPPSPERRRQERHDSYSIH